MKLGINKICQDIIISSYGGFSYEQDPSILILAAVLLVSIACAFPLAVSSNENEVADAVAETVQAALEQTQAAATYTPLPTLTPYPTYTPASQKPYYPQPTYAQQNCNQAKFITKPFPTTRLWIQARNLPRAGA